MSDATHVCGHGNVIFCDCCDQNCSAGKGTGVSSPKTISRGNTQVAGCMMTTTTATAARIRVVESLQVVWESLAAALATRATPTAASPVEVPPQYSKDSQNSRQKRQHSVCPPP
jgi:hypothetical protein